jgi:hypothetical protein
MAENFFGDLFALFGVLDVGVVFIVEMAAD